MKEENLLTICFTAVLISIIISVAIYQTVSLYHPQEVIPTKTK